MIHIHLIKKVKVTVKVIGSTSILSLLFFPRSEDGSNLVDFKLHQQIVIDLSFVSDWSKEGRKFTIVRSKLHTNVLNLIHLQFLVDTMNGLSGPPVQSPVGVVLKSGLEIAPILYH